MTYETLMYVNTYSCSGRRENGTWVRRPNIEAAYSCPTTTPIEGKVVAYDGGNAVLIQHGDSFSVVSGPSEQFFIGDIFPLEGVKRRSLSKYFA